MTKKETESERARAKALREQLPVDLQAKISELDNRLVKYLEEYDKEKEEGEEDNTAIRNLRAVVAEAIKIGSVHPTQGTIGPKPLPSTPPEGSAIKISAKPDPEGATIPSPSPEPITKPAVTRPNLQALAESRTEPDSTRLERDFRNAPISPLPHSGGRILVIDDDPDIRETIEGILRDEGYKVCPANNGKEGLKRLMQMPDCDLVLLDVMMPIMGGFEFLEYFDANPAWTMPVVILSAHMKDRDYHPGEDGGLEVFIGDKPREALKKPIYLEGFLTIIREKVREGKQRRRT